MTLLPPITLREVEELLSDALRPHYKGLPGPDGVQEFRRQLTGEEAITLFTKIHNTVKAIRSSREEQE